MKKYLTATVVLALLGGGGGWPSAGRDTWKQVSSFQYDWDHRGATRFIFELPSAGANSNEDFTRVRILVPGQKEFVLESPDGWLDYTSKYANIPLKLPANLAPSHLLLAAKASENRTLIFLFGQGDSVSFGRFDVLEISGAGQPVLVLHRDEFKLEEFQDLDGDGIPELVGKTCMSQTWGNDLLTYDPFNVIELAALPGGPAKLSVPLSNSYNLKHYYGWAGPDCSEKFAVVLHPRGGGKPVVVSRGEAVKLSSNK